MPDSDRHIVRTRLAYWPGERLACAWPLDPDEEERFWLVNRAGQVAATFWRYQFGRGVPTPRGT